MTKYRQLLILKVAQNIRQSVNFCIGSLSYRKFVDWIIKIGKFVLGQIVLQFLTILTGIFLIHWLPKYDYAQYSVAFGFQSLATGLIDLNFGTSVTALIGSRSKDSLIVGNYIRSAIFIRNRMFITGCVFIIFIFPLLINAHKWSLFAKLLILLSIIIYAYAQGLMIYSIPLRITGDLSNFYFPQIIGSGVRILLNFLLWHWGFLKGWTSVGITAMTALLTGLLVKRNAHEYIAKTQDIDSEALEEMRRYIRPFLPGVIFTVFQGQISLALITILGHTNNIAEVGALTRLSQIFNLISAFNLIIFEPYISTSPVKYLFKRYLRVLLLNFMIVFLLFILSLRFSGVFIYILGYKYANLHQYVHIFVISSGIGCFSQSIWMMSSVRKWVFWWTSWFHIVVVLSVQVACVLLIRVNNTENILYFQMYTNIATLLSQVFIAFSGIKSQYKTKNNRLIR